MVNDMNLKYRVFSFLIVALCITFVWPVHANESLPLMGKKIVVDAGHGGEDPGTLSGDVLEKDINLKISLFLEQELSRRGASVILTRRGDYDLSKPNASRRKKSDFDNRIALINTSGADLFLSVHLNYLPKPQYKGMQVFYQNQNKTSEKLANEMQKYINETMNMKREAKRIPSTTYMYSKLEVLGVLVECGFLSNAEEKELLQTEAYQKKIASAIAEAVAGFY